MQNRKPVEVRVQRTVSVLQPSVKDFMELAIETAEHSHKVMGIEPDLFMRRGRGRGGSKAEFIIHTDFPSMAAYEDLFLYGLLFDATYLQLAARANKYITDEPLDEMYVRLLPDDYFFGLTKKRKNYAFESAKPAAQKTRYRYEREYCAAKGRLADVMEMNFEHMDYLHNILGNPPKYFCTRFSQERIGCSKMYIDKGDPPPDEAFIAQDVMIARDHPEMLLSPPIESVLVRVDRTMVGALP